MADKDNRQGPFSRVLQKHAGRAKERILQNFGKADRTTDEDFDIYVKDFNRQQAATARLHKEFKNYYTCLRGMQVARRSLMDTVCELYEPCWYGLSNVMTKAEFLNQNYEELCEKINETVLVPVSAYAAQFPELQSKIAKRNRKLLDYDNSRHNYENLDSMKKREESKIAKAKEHLEEKRSLFEVINSELHDELPALYDSRLTFFVSHLQKLFYAEAVFDSQDSVLLLEINCLLEKIEVEKKNDLDDSGNRAIEFGSPMPVAAAAVDSSPPQQLESDNSVNATTVAVQDFKFSAEGDGQKPEPDIEPPVVKKCDDVVLKEKIAEEDNQDKDDYSSGSASGSLAFSTPPTTSARNVAPDITSDLGKTAVDSELQAPPAKPHAAAGDGDGYRHLYNVRSTYRYIAEDVDELSFDVGDIIDVIEFEDPDEQEEGWLLGILNGVKGLFPANFTSRI